MMTELQRDALARAKAGDWKLADAMELTQRADDHARLPAPLNGELAFDGVARASIGRREPAADVVCGLLVDGRLRAIAYGDARRLSFDLDGKCTTCEGEGVVECGECGKPGECGECDGLGYFDNSDDLDALEEHELTTLDLNGDPFNIDDATSWLSIGEARRVLEQYKGRTGPFAPAPAAQPATEVPACA